MCKKIIFILLMVSGFSPFIYAASFDCGKASTNIEKTICNDRTLSELDYAMAYHYRSVLSLASVKERQDAIKGQRKWLKYRNGECGKISNGNACLSKLYSARIKELEGQFNALGGIARLMPADPVDQENMRNLVEKYIDVKMHYARDEQLCSAIEAHVYEFLYDSYKRKVTVKNMPYLNLQTLTSGLELTPHSIGGWKEHPFRWTSGDKGDVRQASKKYFFEDINNDGESEYVQRINDSNNISGGYGWIVIPSFNPQEDSVVDGKVYASSPSFNFRSNNVDDSKGGERRSKNATDDESVYTSKNFFFDFFIWENKRYLLLLLNYGYGGGIFDQQVIVSDLGEDFKIKQDHCHIQLSVAGVDGRLNK